MKIQKRLISALLALVLLLSMVNAVAEEETFSGEIENGILIEYTGTKKNIVADDFPEEVKVIGASAFKGDSIESIVIPNRVTSIGAKAFEDCRELTSVTLPNKLKTIHEDTFHNCSSLKEIVIPDSVTTVKDNAFANCNSLDDVWGPMRTVKSLQREGTIVYRAVSGTLTTLGNGVFNNCTRIMVHTVRGSKLEEYCIANSVEYVSLQPLVESLKLAESQYNVVYSPSETRTITIVPTVTPETAKKAELAWTSSDEQLASLDQEGVVSAVKPGMTMVTVRGDLYDVAKGTKKATATILVLDGNKSWQEWDGEWYYVAGDTYYTGFNKIGSSTFYFDKYGRMQTGFMQIGGKWYWFHENGVMLTGWQVRDGAWVYFEPEDGGMVIGWKKIGGLTYYFNPNGTMQTGWKIINNKWYAFTNNGDMMTGWKKLGSAWYYFHPVSGQMMTGWVNYSKKWYYMDGEGAMVTGWLKDGNNWYYLLADGHMATGTLKIDGVTYTFAGDGHWVP